MKYVLLISILSIFSGSFDSCKQKGSTKDENRPIKLLFNFEQDSTYKYIVKSNIEIKPQIKDKDITIHQDMTIACNYRKISQKGTSNEIMVTYERIIISSGSGFNQLEYDSDNDDGVGKIFQGVRDLIKKPFNMMISPYGNILSSSGIADKKNDGNYFSDTAFQKVMLQALQIYPQKIIQNGTIWQRKFPTSIGFIHVIMNSNYKLMFVNNQSAHVEITSRINSTTKKSDSQDVSISGIQTGSIDVDINSGLITNGKLEQQLSGYLYLNGKETPVNINASTHIMGTKVKTPERL